MKKYLLLMLTLLAIGFANTPLLAQNTLTVANGTDTSDYVPVYGYYSDAYLRSQTIYPASMLTGMSGSAITSMSFYFSTTPEYNWNSIYAVKLLEVSDSVFSSTEYLSTANAQTVYTGLLANLGGVMGVNFDLPFNYFGGNLLVEFVSVTPGEYYAKCSFFGINSPNSSMQSYSYIQVPGDNSTPENRNFIPKTSFSYSTANYCETPSTIYTSDLGATSVTIHWNGNNHAESYLFQYMLAEQTDWDNDATELTVTDSSILLINLQPSAAYQCRVRTICNSADSSYWSPVFEFSMLNYPVTAPYFQDFETNPSNISDFYFTHSGINKWHIGQATFVMDSTFSLGHSLYISDNNGISNTYDLLMGTHAYATLDVVFDSTQTDWLLSFDYKVLGESPYWDFFSVYITDDTAAIPAEGVPSGTALLYQATNVTTWTHHEALLENVAGTTKKIIFYWKNDSSLGHNPPAAVDNISIVGIIPYIPCTTPSHLTSTEISNSQVNLIWSGDADQYAVYMSGTDSGYFTTTDTFIVISGLTGNSPYSFQVRSLCGADSSELTPMFNVTTLSDPIEPCEAPTGLMAGSSLTLESGNSIMLTWDNNDNVSMWNVQYMKENDDWVTETVNVNSYQVHNVILDMQYYARVQAVCGDEETSDWSETIGFMITGIDDHLLNSITLYPNPANDVINVQCTMNNVKSVEVTDVYGKVINTLTVTDNPTQINVSGLASGIYFVRVTTEEGVVTKSFVKK